MVINSDSEIAILLADENKSWVIEKLAQRLSTELTILGHKIVQVSKYTNQNKINLWMFYYAIPLNDINFSDDCKHYALVTHVNDYSKLVKLKTLVNLGVIPIFLSQDTYEFVNNSLSKKLPKNIIRLGSDIQNFSSNKLKVAMCSNIYADGRKNENWILDLAKNNQSNQVIFRFVGSGWHSIVSALTKMNFEVEYFPNAEITSYDLTLDAIKWCDLYIYTGWDEGALGCLDAYILGKNLLISSQGFHRDFNLGSTERFTNKGEFIDNFSLFLQKYNSGYGAIINWTWHQMALDFLEILKISSQALEPNNNNAVRYKKSTLKLLNKSILKKIKHLIWKIRNSNGAKNEPK